MKNYLFNINIYYLLLRVRACVKLPWGKRWELNLGLLQEHYMFLTIEPSSPAQNRFLVKNNA